MTMSEPSFNAILQNAERQRRTPATRQVIRLYETVHGRLGDRLQWVMSPATAEQLHHEWPKFPGDPGDEPDYNASPTTTMFGMPIRYDEHATTIMLELR